MLQTETSPLALSDAARHASRVMVGGHGHPHSRMLPGDCWATRNEGRVSANDGWVKRVPEPRPLMGPEGDMDEPLWESALEAERYAATGVCRGRGDTMLERVCQRAAARAGRKLLWWYGVTPSDASLEDAGRDGVARVIHALTHECYTVDGRQAIESMDTLWETCEGFRRYVCSQAALAAWNSLKSWNSEGLAGRNDRKPVFHVSTEDVSEARLSEALDAMSQHLTQPEHVTAQERRFAIRSIWRRGYFAERSRLRNQALATRLGTLRPGQRPLNERNLTIALTAARRRCRVVARVIGGESLLVACIRAGYRGAEPVGMWRRSCEQSDFWRTVGVDFFGRASSAAEMRSRLGTGHDPVHFGRGEARYDQASDSYYQTA